MTAKVKPTETVEKMLETGKERFEQVVKASQETAAKNYEKAVEYSRKQMDESMKAMDELTTFAKGNVDAMVASGQAAAKGIEQLGKVATDYSKKAAADAQETFKALSTAKTAKEFFEIHNSSLKAHYDAFVTEASKMTELMFKVGSEVAEPVSTRMALAMEKVTKPVK